MPFKGFWERRRRRLQPLAPAPSLSEAEQQRDPQEVTTPFTDARWSLDAGASALTHQAGFELSG